MHQRVRGFALVEQPLALGRLRVALVVIVRMASSRRSARRCSSAAARAPIVPNPSSKRKSSLGSTVPSPRRSPQPGPRRRPRLQLSLQLSPRRRLRLRLRRLPRLVSVRHQGRRRMGPRPVGQRRRLATGCGRRSRQRPNRIAAIARNRNRLAIALKRVRRRIAVGPTNRDAATLAHIRRTPTPRRGERMITS